MNQFNLGKKIFFLYPPVDFSNAILRKLFEDGYEIYKLNNTEKLLPLLESYPDSVLFINSDYPYEDFDLQKFNDKTLHLDIFKDLQVFSFFREGVTYGDKIKDYISLDQSEQEILKSLNTILEGAEAHGKREHVRFGSYSETISQFTFECEGNSYTCDLHDICPKALSLSGDADLEHCLSKELKNINLTVGAYQINVCGILSQKREIAGKELYIAEFDGTEYENDLYNFIYTSLEKKMDEFIQTLK